MTRTLLAAVFFLLAWSLPAKAIPGTLEMACLPPALGEAEMARQGMRAAQTFRDGIDRPYVLWLGQDDTGRQTWVITMDLTDDLGRTWRCILGGGPPVEDEPA